MRLPWQCLRPLAKTKPSITYQHKANVDDVFSFVTRLVLSRAYGRIVYIDLCFCSANNNGESDVQYVVSNNTEGGW